MKKALLVWSAVIAMSFGASCGEDVDGGGASCEISYLCDGSVCQANGSACTSGDYLEEDGITDQASCEEWGEAKAQEKNATLNWATYDPDGDC